MQKKQSIIRKANTIGMLLMNLNGCELVSVLKERGDHTG
jgi:hypothetical protein